MADTLVDRLKPPEALLEQLAKGEISSEIYDWMERNQYCHNLVMPEDSPLGLNKRKMFRELQEYVGMAMNIHVDYRTVTKKAIVLELLVDTPLVTSTGGVPFIKWHENGKWLQMQNQPIGKLVGTYINMALKEHPLPVVDETGLSWPIDILLHREDLKGLDGLNAALVKKGLRLVEKETSVKMIVYTAMPRQPISSVDD